jgi:hypothetical protein
MEHSSTSIKRLTVGWLNLTSALSLDMSSSVSLGMHAISVPCYNHLFRMYMLARSHKTDNLIFCIYSNKSLGHSQMVQRQEWIRFYQQASQLSPTAHSWMCVQSYYVSDLLTKQCRRFVCSFVTCTSKLFCTHAGIVASATIYNVVTIVPVHPPPQKKCSRDDTKEDVFVHQVSKTWLQKHFSLQIVPTSLIFTFSSISYLCTAYSDAKLCFRRP